MLSLRNKPEMVEMLFSFLSVCWHHLSRYFKMGDCYQEKIHIRQADDMYERGCDLHAASKPSETVNKLLLY